MEIKLRCAKSETQEGKFYLLLILDSFANCQEKIQLFPVTSVLLVENQIFAEHREMY